MELLLAAEGHAATGAHIDVPRWLWVAFLVFISALILIDLLLKRKDKDESFRQHLVASCIWVGISIAFGFFLWPVLGGQAVSEYFSGYTIEKTLSIDNVFVWSVLLTYFKIPDKYQHRVLFWGIFGALVFRAIFIFGGIAIIEKYESVLILFGLFLLYTGIKTAKSGEEDDDEPKKLIQLICKHIPVTPDLHGHALFTRVNHRPVATMLFVALVGIEFTDVLFAVDSVPAILAISNNPFIVFSSNAMAILGLRALYFLFRDAKEKFSHINKGLGLILVLVGVKMMVAPPEIFGFKWIGYHFPTVASLLIILAILVGSVVYSLHKNKQEAKAGIHEHEHTFDEDPEVLADIKESEESVNDDDNDPDNHGLLMPRKPS